VIVTALTPGVCTAGAVELFVKGMDQYHGIADEFLAWRGVGRGRASLPARLAGAVGRHARGRPARAGGLRRLSRRRARGSAAPSRSSVEGIRGHPEYAQRTLDAGPRRCLTAPVRRSAVGAPMPPTIDPGQPGRLAHCRCGHTRTTFHLRRDAANRGHSGRRPRTCDRPMELSKGRFPRSRSQVTGRATMSDRPRAGNASGGTHRPPNHRIAFHYRGAIFAFGGGRNGGRPPPFP
jgi:hypothetical protein